MRSSDSDHTVRARANWFGAGSNLRPEAHGLPLTACTEVAVFTSAPRNFAWQGHKTQLATRGAKKAKHSYPCGCSGPRPRLQISLQSIYWYTPHTGTQRAPYCPALAALSDPPRRQRREHRQSPGEHLHRQQHSQSINRSPPSRKRARQTERDAQIIQPAAL